MSKAKKIILLLGTLTLLLATTGMAAFGANNPSNTYTNANSPTCPNGYSYCLHPDNCPLNGNCTNPENCPQNDGSLAYCNQTQGAWCQMQNNVGQEGQYGHHGKGRGHHQGNRNNQ